MIIKSLRDLEQHLDSLKDTISDVERRIWELSHFKFTYIERPITTHFLKKKKSVKEKEVFLEFHLSSNWEKNACQLLTRNSNQKCPKTYLDHVTVCN